MKKLLAVPIFLALFGIASSVGVAGRTEEDATFEALSDSITNVDGNRNNEVMINITDPALETSKHHRGNQETVNVEGHAPTGVQTTSADIWDLADESATQSAWTAPTSAQLHNVASADANDTSAGTGARTVRVAGLTDWNSGEVSEVITMSGLTNVSTKLSYVVINEMEVLTYGTSTSGPNVGTVTATAVTDATRSAVILPAEGKSHSTVYGIPSSEIAYIKDCYGSVNLASGGAAHINFSLMANVFPGTSTTFIDRGTRGLQSTGTSHDTWEFDPPLEIESPHGVVLKMSALGSAADIDASAGYSLIRADRSDILGVGLQTILTEGHPSRGGVKEILTVHGRELIRER